MIVSDIAFQFFFDSGIVMRDILVGIIPNAIIAAIFIYMYDLVMVKKNNETKDKKK